MDRSARPNRVVANRLGVSRKGTVLRQRLCPADRFLRRRAARPAAGGVALLRGGHVAHSYADHVSILKFIERNWRLEPLSARSRDNLPNPIADEDDPYVPVNGPAISDLFVMFEFQHDHDHRNHE